MTGTGKIARLPFNIRNQLNERLRNGEQGKDLVAWLNGMWVVKQVLDEEFDGRPISEQNLSGWKQREHQQWLKREEQRRSFRGFLDEAEEFEEELDGTSLTDRLTEMATLAVARLLQTELKAEEKGPKHRAAVVELLRELGRLREGDHEMERLRLQRERWDIERKRHSDEDRNQEVAERKAHLCGRIFAGLCRKTLVEALGGGEVAEKAVDLLNFIENDIPLPKQSRKKSLKVTSPSDSPTPNGASDATTDQTKSSLIKPNQTADCAPATVSSFQRYRTSG